jgi:RNA polymerase sigma factor for flagellar operon FliA
MVASAGRAKKRTEKGPSSPADRLWTAFFRHRSIENRNRLIEFYLPLVRYNAQRIHARFPASVEIDDLISAGIFGLMDAIDSFDRARKVKFETYSQRRISGSILDWLRAQDWVPRLVRSKVAKITIARDELARKGEVTDWKLCRRLGITKAELVDWQRETCNVPQITSLHAVRHCHIDHPHDREMHDGLADEAQPRADDHLDAEAWWDELLRGVQMTAKVAILLYFRHGWTMKTIGRHLGLSESRVSQLTSATMQYLRSYRCKDDFSEITFKGNGVPPKLLPLLAYCHAERARQRRKPANKFGPIGKSPCQSV